MEKKMIKCDGLSDKKINKIISDYKCWLAFYRNIKRISSGLFMDSFGVD